MRPLSMLFLLAGFLAGCATDQSRVEQTPSGREQSLVEMRAIVTGVDQPRRLLAIQEDGGGKAVLPIAEEFRDFDKLRVGDAVVVSLTEAIAWKVKPAADGAPGLSTREALVNPKPGEAPGGAIERAITITSVISSLDAAAATVTLTGPEGASQTFKVRNAADLDHVRVGDLVDITYSEVRALSVRPAARP